MGENTKIEWCHHSFNPWTGCQKVSAACDFCYAEAWAKRTGKPELWQGERHHTSASNWRQPLKWDRAAEKAGERHRVFCASLADVFDNQVPIDWRSELWALIADTPHLDWLLLTKRPQNIGKMLPSTTCQAMIAGRPWPWPNVWLGTTVENQGEADRRIPHLLSVKARVRFLSCEPLLGPVDLTRIPWRLNGFTGKTVTTANALRGTTTTHHPVFGGGGVAPGIIDWVITGGESGPKARPTDPDWFRSLREQCAAAGVAFHFKQWGEWVPWRPSMSGYANLDGPTLVKEHCGKRKPRMWQGYEIENGGVFPPWMLAMRVGKKAAGRMLDGREHNEFPQAA